MSNSADPDSWLLQKPTDLDLHCLLRQGMSCSAREGLIVGIMFRQAGRRQIRYIVVYLLLPDRLIKMSSLIFNENIKNYLYVSSICIISQEVYSLTDNTSHDKFRRTRKVSFYSRLHITQTCSKPSGHTTLK